MSDINDTEEFSEGDFPIDFKTIDQYQRKYPSLLAKYEMVTYKKGYFCGDSNTQLKLIIHKDNVVITLIIQRYVLYWYHTYLLHPGMDVTAATIFQYLYWNGIRNAAQKEGSDCDTCQRTKFSNTKYSKLLAKE